MSDHPRWNELPWRARTWRIGHGLWSVVQLSALGYTWRCALTGNRTPRLWACVGFLGLEGAALVIGRGNCPVGERQEAWGDPVPFFELLLPPRAAKAAIPALAIVSSAGIGAVLLETVNDSDALDAIRCRTRPSWSRRTEGHRGPASARRTREARRS
jgi:hypothetical protein